MPVSASTSEVSASPVESAGLIVRVLETDERDRWDAFVSTSPGGSFYHRFAWLPIMEQEFGHVTIPLVATSADEIVGILPLVLVRSRLFGRILCSMPFLNYGGPVSRDADVDCVLIDQARQVGRELGVDYLELRSTRRLDNDLVVSANKISMTVPLQPDSEVLWNGFSSKHRTNVRRAFKGRLSVRKGGAELLPAFYGVLSRSWRDQGTPIYRRSFFERIADAFGDSIDIFLCEHDGEPVATAFNGTFRGNVEGMWAGATPAGRKLQYSYVLYWEMIKDACDRGLETYHLGRSSVDSGGETFKRKWNATTTQLYWHFDLVKATELPGLNVDNPRYAAAITAWRKLPVAATRVIGPLVARGIP